MTYRDLRDFIGRRVFALQPMSHDDDVHTTVLASSVGGLTFQSRYRGDHSFDCIEAGNGEVYNIAGLLWWKWEDDHETPHKCSVCKGTGLIAHPIIDCWTVIWGDRSPCEVESIWLNKESAGGRRQQLLRTSPEHDWKVHRRDIYLQTTGEDEQ